MVALIHDDDIPFIPKGLQVQAAHGLHRCKGDAPADIDLPVRDSPRQRGVHVLLRPLLALTQKVLCVGQPQGFAAQPCRQSNTHLGLSASGGTLEDAAVHFLHPVNSLCLVVIERDLTVEVHLLGGQELALNTVTVGIDEHILQDLQAPVGKNQSVTVLLIEVQILRGVTGVEPHPLFLDKLRIAEAEVLIAVVHQGVGGFPDSDLIADTQFHAFTHSSTVIPCKIFSRGIMVCRQDRSFSC